MIFYCSRELMFPWQQLTAMFFKFAFLPFNEKKKHIYCYDFYIFIPFRVHLLVLSQFV